MSNEDCCFLVYIYLKPLQCDSIVDRKQTTRGPRGPWNAHLRVKIFKSSLFSLLYIQQATPGGCKSEVMFK